MYSKIALGNVKKSYKDYSIYFLTLTLAVCIFYSFNSIESQKAILELNQSESENLDMMLKIISYISVFVSCILGCLIVYANNFLIKKRKRELGIYMTLGMGKGKISKILIIETVLVGIISLIGGILLGIVLSQGLSIFTSKLFDVSMSEYKFIFSSKAMSKTILYFGLIFILVTILNSFTISKYKIIDLLNYSKKSEDIKIKSSIIYIFIFIIAVLCLIVAYKTIINNGLELNYKFSLSIILGIIGTVLVFFSLAGFGVNIIKKSKSIYFKDLNIFIVKQLNSKINTNFISMSVICLMLFITIVMLSTGLSFKNALEKSLEETTPFDATATMYYDSEYQNDIESTLKELNFNLDDNEKYAYYNEYIINI
ncbi:FtsX-like permease family protein [Romboutsia sp. CE17]|uniref:FtsX-like permease family protein n=1 Tax=Romboutsia sp. CE17 TaxID=2724150 RepID=UPI002ED2D7B5